MLIYGKFVLNDVYMYARNYNSQAVIILVLLQSIKSDTYVNGNFALLIWIGSIYFQYWVVSVRTTQHVWRWSLTRSYP